MDTQTETFAASNVPASNLVPQEGPRKQNVEAKRAALPASVRFSNYEFGESREIIPVPGNKWILPNEPPLAIGLRQATVALQNDSLASRVILYTICDPLAPGGEKYTVYEVAGEGKTCTMSTVNDALLDASLLVMSLHRDNKVKDIWLSDVGCLILTHNYPQELFKEWVPMKDKNTPGLYTFAPDATRVCPSLRVVVVPEVDDPAKYACALAADKMRKAEAKRLRRDAPEQRASASICTA